MRASIVICTWKRKGPLERCLLALRDLGFGPSAQVAIVTVHPPGNEESEAAAARIFPEGLVVRTEVANLSLQRNRGAEAAPSDVIVYLDDDAWPTEGWLGRILRPFADPAVAAVGGPVVDPSGRLMRGAVGVTSFGRTYPVEDPSTCETLALSGGNLAVRRVALEDVGGFDENYRYHLDETDLCMRLARAGKRLVYCEDAAIFHESAPGPHRRTPYDRDWHSVAKNQVYFGFRHVRRARLLLAIVPWALQVPKLLRFLVWWATGRLGARAALSCASRLVKGTLAGYRKGLARKPRLPLRAAETGCRARV